MKRFLCALLALALSLTGWTALAEELPRYSIGDAIEYEPGVVARGRLMDFALFARLEELEVAYLSCDQPYLVKGEPATWTVTATGGSGEYQYIFYLFYRTGTSGLLYCCDSQEMSASPSFTHTPVYGFGQYMVKVQVIDETGEYLEWHSPIYTASAPGDETRLDTVAGKVRYLAERCLVEAGESEFARALWLHDWLTEHAEYDLTYTYYYPEGVLLYGTGVCQSYALAYGMLLREVGIDSLFITGEAGGGDHAWNLVKLNGSWYHVDCTWDDPVGGTETHAYFAITDEQMAKDHVWAREDGILPACTSTECAMEAMIYAANTESVEDGMSKLRQAVATEQSMLYLVFPDAQMAGTFADAAEVWVSEEIASGALRAVSCDDRWEYFREDDHLYWQKWGSAADGSRLCILRMDYGEGYEESDEAVYAHFITASVALRPGETVRPSLYVAPQDGTGLSWKTSNAAVATFSDGVVTANAPGWAVITVVTPAGEATSCRVVVLSDEQLVIAGNIKTIAAEAFRGCESIQTLIVETGVQTIGARAFADCEGLITAYIPASVAFIAEDAFAGCEGLTIVCPADSAAAAFAGEAGIPHRENK